MKTRLVNPGNPRKCGRPAQAARLHGRIQGIERKQQLPFLRGGLSANQTVHSIQGIHIHKGLGIALPLQAGEVFYFQHIAAAQNGVAHGKQFILSNYQRNG